jgi:hypothetical protein
MLRRVALVTRATRRNIPEDTILHSHFLENLKSLMYCVLRKAVFANKKRRKQEYFVGGFVTSLPLNMQDLFIRTPTLDVLLPAKRIPKQTYF